VPSAFDMWVIATSRVRGPISRSSSSIRSAPVSSIGTTRSRPPVMAHTICHGTMLEWCSIAEMSTSSPSRRSGRTKLCATRLIPSVALRVKTISRTEAA